jgi:hypothetical protein
MAGFIRRFAFDPGNDVLLNIESINILDLQPPAALAGIGTGAVLCVGEFDNGPYNFVLEVNSAPDMARQFGSVGFTYNGVQAQNPSAIARRADGAPFPEYWNGNGPIQLNGKQFARLLLCRVNTSVGQVQFVKLPFVSSTVAALTYALANGDVLSLDLGAGPVNATFTAAAAAVTGSGAAFGSITAGLQAVLGYDAASNFTVTFQTGDTTIANVVARINAAAGFAFASNNAGQLELTGLQQGSGGSVRVVSGTALADLGLTAGTTLGTGNVSNVLSVSQHEIQGIVQAAVANSAVVWDSQSRIRISNTAPSVSPYILVTGATSQQVQTALGLVAGQVGTQNGQAIVVSGTVTLTLATSDTVTLGIDNYPNVVVTFQSSDNSVALIVSRINAAFAAAGQPTVAFADGTANFYLSSSLTNTSASQVRVVSSSTGAVLTKLGLVLGTTVGVGAPLGVLPAGTQVNVPGGQQFVTAQDVNFTTLGVFIGGTSKAGGGTVASQNGPFLVPVRHALDDGSGLAAIAGSITALPLAPDVGSFSVTNLQPTSAALGESAIDAAYVNALTGPTVDINTVAKQANVIFSARQSNTVRGALRTNAISASSQGCYGRRACVRPPLNTDEPTALGSAAPGVGATRDERTIYCYIGSNVFVPILGAVGMAGNPANTGYTAFTPDGNIDVGSDSLLAAVMSQLPPEENPGQDTPFTTAVNGIESGANVQGFQMADYISFKAAGICALRIDDGVASFQSGVTSVDPTVYPQLTTIARRRMADYIQDSVAQRGKAYSKKLNTVARRRAFSQEVIQFFNDLLGVKNPSFQRIGGYTVSLKNNTVDSLGIGIFRLTIAVQTLSSMDAIVLETTIGNTVSVQVTLPQQTN